MYTTKVMFFIAALLLVNSLFVKGQVCNVGESQVKNFELKRFLGLWHIDLISSEDFAKKFSCWDDNYILDGHAIYSSYYCRPDKNWQNTTGSIECEGSKCTVVYPSPSAALYYVQYRNKTARGETDSVVKSALQQYGKTFEKLHCICNCKE